ncbi:MULTISPECIES: hypothetical protein [Streptomyces]|nr:MULTISPECIES: hypothetical protein [Streptomyces]
MLLDGLAAVLFDTLGGALPLADEAWFTVFSTLSLDANISR